MPAIGSMEVVLSADAAALLTALDRVERRMQKAEADTNKHAAGMASSFGRVTRAIQAAQTVFVGWVAAVGASRLVQWFNAAAEEVDKLGKSAHRLGLSVEEMSGLRFAAKEAGVEFQALSTMAGKAMREVAEAVDKGKTVEQVGSLVVRLTDANGEVRKLSDLLPDIARGIESAGSSAEQLRLAERFFGRGGGDRFVTLLKESGTFVKGLAEQTERARRLGVLFTEDQFEKLRAYNDALGRIDEALLGLRVNLLTRVAPALTQVWNTAASAIAAAPEMVERLLDAFSGTGELAESLDRVGQSIGAVAKRSVELAIRLAWGVAQDMLTLVWPALKDSVSLGLHDAIIKPTLETISNLVRMVQMVFPEVFPGTMRGIYTLVEAAEGVLRPAMAAQVDIFEELDKKGSSWMRQWGIGTTNLSEAFGILVEDADKLLGVSELMAKHAMDGFQTASDKAQEAADAIDERIADLAERGGQEIRGFARSAGDAFADVALKGRRSFGELLESWGHTLLSMASQAIVFKPFFDTLGGGFSSLFSSGPSPEVAGPPAPSAHGRAFIPAHAHQAAHGLLMRERTYIPHMNAVAAESSTGEVLAPVRTMSGGDLGVKSAPAQVGVTIIDQRSGGARPSVSEHTDQTGKRWVRVLIRDEVGRAMSDGSLDKTMARAYGLRRQGVGR